MLSIPLLQSVLYNLRFVVVVHHHHQHHQNLFIRAPFCSTPLFPSSDYNSPLPPSLSSLFVFRIEFALTLLITLPTLSLSLIVGANSQTIKYVFTNVRRLIYSFVAPASLFPSFLLSSPRTLCVFCLSYYSLSRPISYHQSVLLVSRSSVSVSTFLIHHPTIQTHPYHSTVSALCRPLCSLSLSSSYAPQSLDLPLCFDDDQW